jgi:peptidoglycan-associated lipoprotein
MGTRWRSATILTLLLTLVLIGCAKRPATTAVSAPPPTTGSATVTPPPPTTAITPLSPGTTVTPPAAAPPTRPPVDQFHPVAELQDIHFDFDKYDIRPGDAKILDTNATWLKSHEDQLLLVEGHCDERGTNEYNLALGERRAKATMNYLVSQGVQANRVTIISYGEERPLCTEHNETCWAKNRRAHFLVKAR